MMRGLVEATNERGIKLNGRWLNYSQFRQVTHPDVGQEVEVEVERDRFINVLTVLGGGSGDVPLDFDGDDDLSGENFAGLDVAPGDAFSSGAGGSSGATGSMGSAALGRGRRLPAPRPATPMADRNTEIRRLALIKAAADYSAQRLDLTPDDVLAVARQWERWIVEREAIGEPPEVPEGPGGPEEVSEADRP
jgi:hypothetical protein